MRRQPSGHGGSPSHRPVFQVLDPFALTRQAREQAGQSVFRQRPRRCGDVAQQGTQLEIGDRS
ncbi:hypothetical protein ADK82_18465 [Streptomyces sp. NRRL S-4]|nr:hypothetical protein ADK82_18465 [Streptomyces sp. NRRL S-4]